MKLPSDALYCPAATEPYGASRAFATESRAVAISPLSLLAPPTTPFGMPAGLALALGLLGGLAAGLLQVADVVRLGLLAVVLGVDSDDADTDADGEGGRGGEGGQPGLPLGGS